VRAANSLQAHKKPLR